MKNLVWLHDFSLNDPQLTLPGLEAQNLEAIFVLDPGLFETPRQSLKRLEFQVSAALDAGAHVYKGDTLEILTTVCATMGQTEVKALPAPRPWFQTISTGLKKAGVNLITIDPADFAPDIDYDLRRFFRYWNKAKKGIMSPPPPLLRS